MITLSPPPAEKYDGKTSKISVISATAKWTMNYLFVQRDTVTGKLFCSAHQKNFTIVR